MVEIIINILIEILNASWHLIHLITSLQRPRQKILTRMSVIHVILYFKVDK